MDMAKLMWIKDFSDNEIYAPFIIETDNEYQKQLKEKYSHFITLLEKAGADEESIRIAKKYTNKICEALRDYYFGRISTCHQKIENLIKGCANNKLAVSTLEDCRAFPGSGEIQFFRARCEKEARIFKPKEMLHRPFSQRARTGNYRFSIPGVSCIYLANSSYGSWIEMGMPSEHDFNVSPFILNGKQKVLNLAVMTRDLRLLNDGEESAVHCWIKLLVLMIATSFRVSETSRSFRSEYIISQSVMLACKKLGYDGVVYFSKRVDDERFAQVAINLALFAEYRKDREYGAICETMKVDESMNYQLFRQLNISAATLTGYPLRTEKTPYITNIGNYKHQYRYSDTEFYRFDEHLFARWKDKDEVEWGNALV